MSRGPVSQTFILTSWTAPPHPPRLCLLCVMGFWNTMILYDRLLDWTKAPVWNARCGARNQVLGLDITPPDLSLNQCLHPLISVYAPFNISSSILPFKIEKFMGIQASKHELFAIQSDSYKAQTQSREMVTTISIIMGIVKVVDVSPPRYSLPSIDDRCYH